MGVETLTKTVTDYIQQYTQIGGARPFGVALVVGGIENGEPRLFETDPSGTPYEWKALAIGENRADIREYLEERYNEELSLDEGIELALGALSDATDELLDPEGLGLATITVDDESFHQYPVDELESVLDEHDLLASDEDDAADE